MTADRLYIWDVCVRLTHWTVALLFLANFWWLEEGERWHEWCGYALVGVLAVRFVWGFVGSSTARFSDFFPTPKRLVEYCRTSVDTALTSGHNPIGACMIFFLWFMLVLVSISGWLQTTDRYWGEEWVQTLHEFSANAVMGAVIVHVLAVLYFQLVKKRELIQPMLIGYRRNSSVESEHEPCGDDGHQ